MILVDAFGLQRLGGGGQGFDVVLEDHVGTGGRGFRRIGRQRRDDADLLVALLDHHLLDDLVLQVRLRQVQVAGQDRELDPVGQHGQPFRSVVEFVVAHRHRVIADGVHELDDLLALVGRVEHRALVLVARVQHDHRLAVGLDLLAQFGDLRGDARDAAKAFVRGLRFLVAGAVVLVDRLDPAVNIVGVQDMQHAVGMCGPRHQRNRGGRGEQASDHG